jgi:hypothetical protein
LLYILDDNGPFLIVQHNPETTNDGTEDVEERTEHRVAAAPIVETQEKQNQVTTLVKHSNNHDRFGHQIEDNIVAIINFIMIQIPPNCSTKNNGTTVAKKLFKEIRGRVAAGASAQPPRYITTRQLGATTRQAIKDKARRQKELNEGDLDGLI